MALGDGARGETGLDDASLGEGALGDAADPPAGSGAGILTEEACPGAGVYPAGPTLRCGVVLIGITGGGGAGVMMAGWPAMTIGW